MKLSLLTALVLIIVLCTACTPAPAAGDRPVIDETRYDSYPSVNAGALSMADGIEIDFATLDEHTADIVKGYILEDGKEELQYLGNSGMVSYGFTVSTLVVTQVYKGSLKVGDRIPLAEDYYFDDVSGTETLIYFENCVPMIPGKDYLLFISASDTGDYAGIYSLNAYSLGRYPVVAAQELSRIEGYTNKQLNLGVNPSERYKEFMVSALEKYN